MVELSKRTTVTIGLLIVIVIAAVAIVVSAAQQDARIDNLEKVWEDAQEKHPKQLKDIHDKLESHAIKIEVVHTKLDTIIENQKEIKEELKKR